METRAGVPGVTKTTGSARAALLDQGRLMTSDEKFWLAIWACAAFTVVALAAIITFGVCHHRKTMIENGYEEVTVQGYSRPCWQKAR